MEFLLSVTATAGLRGVTRKVTLLYHHCLPLLGWGGGAWTHAAEKQTCFPSDSPAAGPAKDSLCEHGATDQSREHIHCRMLGSAYSLHKWLNPEGWCWAPAKPTDITGRSTFSAHLGSSPNLLSQEPPATDTFS